VTEHVRVGEDEPGMPAGPGSFGGRGVTVVEGHPEAGQLKAAQQRELIGGEGFGRRYVEGSRPGVGEQRGQHGQLVGEGFP